MAEAPPNTGSLSGGVLAELSARLHQEKASGLVEVSHPGDGVSRLFVRDGMLAGCLVFTQFKPLGVFLLEQGWIDIVALNESLAKVASEGRPQGEILVELGHLTEEQLDEGLKLHQLSKLRALMDTVEGEYQFTPDAELPRWTSDIAIAPSELGEEPSTSKKRSRKERSARGSAARKALLKKAFKNIPGAKVISGSKQASQPDQTHSQQTVDEATQKKRKQRLMGRAAKELAKRIEDRFKQIGKHSYYEVLGLGKSAELARVKAAYVALIKEFHPDKVSGLGLTDEVTNRLQDVVAALNEAYATLTDKTKRADYDSLLEKGGGSKEGARKKTQAKALFNKGRVLFKKKQFEKAVKFLSEAHEAAPDAPEYMIDYAWAWYMSVPDRSKIEQQVKELLAKAIKLGGVKGMGHYYLGLIARMHEELDKAERHFTQAVAANSNLTEAVSELRFVRRRMEKQQDTKSTGLFKRILGGDD